MRHESSIEMEPAEATWPAVQEGSEAEFGDLFRRYQRVVYGWILRMVRDPATAEDLTIETFWRIHCAHARFDPTREFEPWARRIATHVAIDWLRKQRPESAVPEEFFFATAARDGGDPAVAAEIRQKVKRALGRLPVKLRVAVLLGVIEDRPQKEVAEGLGISAGAVKLRIFRGLRLLRRDLQRQGITP